MSEKYQFCVKIPIENMDDLEEFKAHVASSYGQLRGFLGMELIKAMQMYNMVQELGVIDDPEFLKYLIVSGVRATGADMEL